MRGFRGDGTYSIALFFAVVCQFFKPLFKIEMKIAQCNTLLYNRRGDDEHVFHFSIKKNSTRSEPEPKIS